MKNKKLTAAEYFNRNAVRERIKRCYKDDLDLEEKKKQDALLLEIKSQNKIQLEGFKKELELKSFSDATEKKAFEDKIAALELKSVSIQSAEDIKKISDTIGNLELEVKSLKEKGFKKGSTVREQINEFVEKNAAKIAEIKAAGSGVLEFKAVGAMVDASASNPDGIPDLVGVQVSPPTNVNLRAAIVDGLVSKFGTNLAAFPYTESLPKDGDFAFVLEKGDKPQIDFEIQTRYAQPKKVAAHMVLSDESVTDIPGLQSIAYNFLRGKHDLKKQNGILFGDGIGANLKGATKYGRVFVAGGMANSVPTPNFMDVVNAIITDIFTTHNYTDEMPYMANLVMINPMDFYTQLVAAKDGFGHPLYPMASLFNRVIIGGATIVPFEDIPVGKIFVADMSKYNTTDYVPYTIKIGWINDNLITNQFVIVGESRLHGFVKKLDEQAFVYDDIATVKAAIGIPSL
jgi:hypothetical protein